MMEHMPWLKPAGPAHATYSAYCKGCRCQECVDANRVYHTNRRRILELVPRSADKEEKRVPVIHPISVSAVLFTNIACVYVWKRGDVVLYVGSSKGFINRLYAHNIIKRDLIQPQDEILIYPTLAISSRARQHLEKCLIAELKPILNSRVYKIQHTRVKSTSPAFCRDEENIADVEALLRQGMKSQSIAKCLGISDTTVRKIATELKRRANSDDCRSYEVPRRGRPRKYT